MSAPEDYSHTIAVDGPVASGKTTLAQMIADTCGFHFLDTGLIYRLLGWTALSSGVSPDDSDAILPLAQQLELSFPQTDDLTSRVVSDAASRVAVHPPVRAALIEVQRAFAQRKPGAVLAGRDIGTMICPGAVVKLFITASAEVRADRRYQQLQNAGHAAIRSRVLEDLIARDKRDTERSVAPLVAAPDAIILDTSTLAIDQSLSAVMEHVRAKVA